ncbi:type II toxin-antitoxin system VapC family toxin [Leucobacter viscericola]|uniref:Ribonuclease VapC n=1 Tax=Leucobacter viscericola TaxID=2714935 RepID=A0A6G7XFR0_9MICO|nr:PIN domain-containing protein [Leucobacter viscericola]QIK63434.1 type II toxin-antitoxin system VapC family toxin [Leucobacter viscericola]
MLVYADTSALVKLVIAEAESAELEEWIRSAQVRFMTSSLTLTELPRAVMRTNPNVLGTAYEQLRMCGIVNLDPSLYAEAGRLEPHELRSLDAIHLAAALALGSQLDGILTYDTRLAEAARNVGIRPITIDK